MPRALIVIAPGFDDEQVAEVRGGLESAGWDIVVAASTNGPVKGRRGRDVTADKTPLQLNLFTYDLLFVPDVDDPKVFTEDKRMVNVLYTMVHKGKTAALAGKGVALLVPAEEQKTSPNPVATGNKVLRGEILKGRVVTGDHSLREDLEKAGGRFVDEEHVVDGPIVTMSPGLSARRIVGVMLPVAQRQRYAIHQR